MWSIVISILPLVIVLLLSHVRLSAFSREENSRGTIEEQ